MGFNPTLNQNSSETEPQLAPQEVSVDVLIEKYAKGDEKKAGDN